MMERVRILCTLFGYVLFKSGCKELLSENLCNTIYIAVILLDNIIVLF